jgi:hypothetical protein
LSRNGTGGVYTGSEAQRAAEQRRLDSKPSPKLDCPALTEKILDIFKNEIVGWIGCAPVKAMI